MLDYIVIGVLFLVVVYQGVMQVMWLREKRKESQDLLDRIMSTDYNQYAAIRVNTEERLEKAKEKKEVVSLDELEERMQSQAVAL